MTFRLTPFHTEPVAGAIVEYCHPTSEFWDAWRASKDSLKSAGVSVAKDDSGNWVVKRFKVERQASSNLPNGYELQNPKGLLPYQIAPAGQLCAAILKNTGAIDASDPGTGKTYVFLAAARELGLLPAVFCPLAAIPGWERAAAHMGVRILFLANYEAARSKNFRFGTLTSVKAAKQKSYLLRNFGANVLLGYDEGQKCKGEDTVNSEILIAAGRQQIPTVIMSATLASTPREMKAAGFVLGLHALYNFNEFCKNLGGFQNKFNGWEFTDSLTAMKKLSDEIFPARGVRVRIADLGDAFPETQITADAYPVDDVEVQNEFYDKLVQEIGRLGALAEMVPELQKRANEAYEAYERLQSAEAAQALEAYKERLQEAKKAKAALLTLNLRYRQQSELLKVKLFKEMVKTGLENGLSVAVFVNYEETREQLVSFFKSPSVHGGQSGEERAAAVAAFQADEARVIVLNIQAGGAALSLHDLNGNFPRLALITPTYSDKDLKQVLGRVHRAGGKSKSLQRIVYAKGTIEETVCASVANKLQNLDALNDGDLAEVPKWQLFNGGEDDA